jgi:hypothetical protein
MNHFYSGLNALAMLVVQDGLVALVPDAWRKRFDDPGEAERENALRANRITQFSAAVRLSVEAALRRLEREGKTDVWAEISQADLRCLIATAPASVAHAYRRALAGAPDYAIDAARGQLELYQDLGIRADNVRAALATFPPAPAARESGPSAARPRVVLFTGHMIDAHAGRPARMRRARPFPSTVKWLVRRTRCTQWAPGCDRHLTAATYGLVSRHGAMALSWALDKIGPMARSATDCGTVLKVIGVPDRLDRTSSARMYQPHMSLGLPQSSAGLELDSRGRFRRSR